MDNLSKTDGFFMKSAIVHLIGWVFQLVGHGVFESILLITFQKEDQH